jgi:two-component system NtrC family response regulator/two-component system nitrogen regulation response regulator GlnG
MDIGYSKHAQNSMVEGLAPSRGAAFPPETTEKSASRRVLIVDDERLIRWSLAESLTDAGATVIEASNGSEALRSVTEAAPDVVVLDYRMPDSNDLTLLASIRRLAPRSQVILMTAFGTPEVVMGALDLGAFCVVSKPFEVGQLVALVAQAHASAQE